MVFKSLGLVIFAGAGRLSVEAFAVISGRYTCRAFLVRSFLIGVVDSLIGTRSTRLPTLFSTSFTSGPAL